MLKKILTTTALLGVLSTNAFAVNGPNLSSTSAVLQAIEKPARASINKVESLFTQKRGQLISLRTLAGSDIGSAGGKNAYIESIKVNADYIIKLKLRSAGTDLPTTGQAPIVSAIPQILSGASFYLVPIYQRGSGNSTNVSITSWECMTDSDIIANRYVGEKEPINGDISYVTRYTQSPYFSHCIYANSTTLSSISF